MPDNLFKNTLPTVTDCRYNNNRSSICTREYCPRSSTDQTCEFGATTEGNIPSIDRKDSYCCIYCLNMLKTYQRVTDFFEFSGKANTKELKIRKKTSLGNGFIIIGFVAMAFASHVCLCLKTRLSPFLTAGYLRKYRPAVKDF